MVIARKRFGQHFLEPAWVEKVVRAIDPRPDEAFLEIGPGGGALTRPLAARARSVVAYEIDRDLAGALRAAHIPKLTVFECYYLAADMQAEVLRQSAIPNQSAIGNQQSAIRVSGNLPYNVASPIVFKLAELYAGGLPIA